MKEQLHNTDEDFKSWGVTIDNREVRHDVIFSADAIKGELITFPTDGDGIILKDKDAAMVTQTGQVRINAILGNVSDSPMPTTSNEASPASTPTSVNVTSEPVGPIPPMEPPAPVQTNEDRTSKDLGV